MLGAGAAGTLAAALTLGVPQNANADDGGKGALFGSPNTYDVTAWKIKGHPEVTAQSDVGAVINDIIADIKRRQTSPDARPGAVIFVPPGDYDLRTQVVVDISFLTIAGFGHGFFSRSIRDNVDTDWVAGAPARRQPHPRPHACGHAQAFLVQAERAIPAFQESCSGTSASTEWISSLSRTVTTTAGPESKWPRTTTPSTSPEWDSST